MDSCFFFVAADGESNSGEDIQDNSQLLGGQLPLELVDFPNSQRSA
jgi:hypothetical protein